MATATGGTLRFNGAMTFQSWKDSRRVFDQLSVIVASMGP